MYNQVENELMHFGVLGMKWGVRREEKRQARAKQKEEKERLLQKRVDSHNRILSKLTPEQTTTLIKEITWNGKQDVDKLLDRIGAEHISFDEAYSDMTKKRNRQAIAGALTFLGALTVTTLVTTNMG